MRGRSMDCRSCFPFRFFLCLLAGCFIISCVSVTLFSVALKYKQSKRSISQEAEKGENAVLIMSNFIDARQGDDKMLIDAVVKDDGSRTPVVPKDFLTADAVTVMMR